MLDPINVKYFRFAVGSDIGKETPNDISAKCIICGDSEKDARQKRLHLYKKSGYDDDAVHCFNCEFTGNMYSFLRDTNSNLFEQYKKEKRQSSFISMKKKKEEPELAGAFYQYKPKVEKSTLKTFKLPKPFIKASENEKATAYLERRMAPVSEFYYSEKSFKYGEKYLPLEDCIIIPLWFNRAKGLVYGFQGRSIEGKTFYTYIPDENTGMKVWVGGEYGQEDDIVLVAESVFDAMSMGFKLKSVGAVLGASENEYFDKHFKNVVYCLDNQRLDPTSKKKSKELLKKGEHVFVWPKGVQYKDFNALLTSGMEPPEIKMMIIENTFSGMKGISKLL